MKYEYIIIGSGVAGVTIAKELLKQNSKTSILMLEAGPEFKMKDRRHWWNYVVSGKHPYEFCEDLDLSTEASSGENSSSGKTAWQFKESRLMMYGGSTVHWGGWSLRLKPEDFELKTRTGRGVDWPISYNDLEKYYCKAEEQLSVGGDPEDKSVHRSKPFPQKPFPYTNADGLMIESFERLGISHAKMPLARYSHCITTGTCKYCPFGARYSASYTLDEIISNEQYSNFKLIVEAPVKKLISDSKGSVSEVEYFDKTSGDFVTAAGSKFIICAGAYESPKILLNSKNEYWNYGIGNDKDLVGRFLISHPFLVVRGRKPTNNNRMQQEVDFPTLMSRHYDSPKEQEDGKLFMFKSRSRPRVKLANKMIGGTSKEELDEIMIGDMEIELQGFMEEFGNYDNRVSAAPGDNRFGLPQTDANFTRGSDFEKRAESRLAIMKKVIVDMEYEVVKAYVRSTRGDHASSTCRMSQSADDGVVDKNLKVHDVTNLYVCSNAVFPSAGAVNPTLTLTALSIRLAEHLTLL